MSLELDDMVYFSFPDLDNQMEQEEDSDSDGHSLDTFLAFFLGKGCHIGRGGNISSEIWYTGLAAAVTELGFTSISLLVSSSEEEDPE